MHHPIQPPKGGFVLVARRFICRALSLVPNADYFVNLHKSQAISQQSPPSGMMKHRSEESAYADFAQMLPANEFAGHGFATCIEFHPHPPPRNTSTSSPTNLRT